MDGETEGQPALRHRRAARCWTCCVLLPAKIFPAQLKLEKPRSSTLH